MLVSMVVAVYVAVSRNGKGMVPNKFHVYEYGKRRYSVEQTGTLDLLLSCYTSQYYLTLVLCDRLSF